MEALQSARRRLPDSQYVVAADAFVAASVLALRTSAGLACGALTGAPCRRAWIRAAACDAPPCGAGAQKEVAHAEYLNMLRTSTSLEVRPVFLHDHKYKCS